MGCAAACARQPSPSEQRADAPHQVALIGCIERAGKEGVVIRGRDVTGTVGTGRGREAGGVPSTETMIGGDGVRNERPGTPLEMRASELTPRLETEDGSDLGAHVGQRVLVRGEFEPAGQGHAYDRVKVASIEPVSSGCSQP